MSNIYYTETVIISDIPKYMPIEKLSYEISFSNNKKSIKGNLSLARMIFSVKLDTNQVVAILKIKINNTVIKHIRLSAYDKINTRMVSLKSTISQTCDKPNTVCTFELKMRIYEIDKKTLKAIPVTLQKIEQLQNKTSAYSGYFIHRLSGTVSKTSKDTIKLINSPDLINNKYIKKAIDIFHCTSNNVNDYPRLVYRDLMKELFEYFLLETKDPDTIIDEIGEIFGKKVEDCHTTEIYAFYHIYEALIRKNDKDSGYDKIQHFVYSAVVQYNSTKIGTDIRQYVAEIWDLRGGREVWNDTVSDMQANNLGQAYGLELYKKYHPIREGLRSLD